MRAGECWLFDTWRMHNVVNDHSLPRIHLVADTVGGMRLLAARRPRASAHARRRRLAGDSSLPPDPDAQPSLDFESENVPDVMTPWEMRAARRLCAQRGGAAPELTADPPTAC